MIIYKITNLLNGKIYIGQTIRTLEERQKQHINNAKKGSKTHLYFAMRKYGMDNFKFEILEYAKSKEELNKLETYYINKFDTIRTGYNMVDGGNNNIMFIPAVAEKHKRKMQSKRTREKISKSMKEHIQKYGFSDEHRKNLSKSAMGNHNFGNGDTRSISCFCIDKNGNRYNFHSYKDAGLWWYKNYKPFPYSECVYQRKIKQSIQLGYCYYTPGGGVRKSKIKIDNIKWYREVVNK